MSEQMLRLGVLAAVLACAGAVLAAQGRTSQERAIVHTCGLTDRQFLANYRVQVEAVGIYGSDYVHGEAGADDLIGASEEAARAVRSSAPFDPSLQDVRQLAPAMFLQYADAVRARAAGKPASRQMYLTYSIGARLGDVLREAQPGLAAAGCDVSDLLQ